MDDARDSLEIVVHDAVRKWYDGEWPSFHDAEIVSLTLVREGESLLRVFPAYPEKPAMVDFFLTDVSNLNLESFSPQNVIDGLTFEPVIDQYQGKAIRLQLECCYGLCGWIDTRGIRVELVPGKAPDDESGGEMLD